MKDNAKFLNFVPISKFITGNDRTIQKCQIPKKQQPFVDVFLRKIEEAKVEVAEMLNEKID